MQPLQNAVHTTAKKVATGVAEQVKSAIATIGKEKYEKSLKSTGLEPMKPIIDLIWKNPKSTFATVLCIIYRKQIQKLFKVLGRKITTHGESSNKTTTTKKKRKKKRKRDDSRSNSSSRSNSR